MPKSNQHRPHVVKLTYQLPQLKDGRWLSGEVFAILYLQAGTPPSREQLETAVRPLLEDLQAKRGLEQVVDIFVDIIAEVPVKNALLWDERIIDEASEYESTTSAHGRVYYDDDTNTVEDDVIQPLLSLR